MPMPRMDLSTGNSGSAICKPNSSWERSAIKARRRTEDPQFTQLGVSRSSPSAGRVHSALQMLHVNFPESEDFKNDPPVAIVNDPDGVFSVTLAARLLFQRGPDLRQDCI